MTLLSYLLRFADAKDDNYRVVLNAKGTGHRLISIDNEDIFAHEIVRHKRIKGGLPQTGQTSQIAYDYIVQTKDVLFLLKDLMNKPMAPSVIQQLKEIDPYQLVLQWLGACQQQNERYQQVYAPLNMSPELAPQLIRFGPFVATRLIQELQQVQELVKKHPQTSFGQLFESLRPLSAAFYQALRHQPNLDLRQAQDTLWGNKQATKQLTLNIVIQDSPLKALLADITTQASDYQYRNDAGRCVPPDLPIDQARTIMNQFNTTHNALALDPKSLKGLLDGLQQSFPQLLKDAVHSNQLGLTETTRRSWLAQDGLLIQALAANCSKDVIEQLLQMHPHLHHKHPETQRTAFHEAARANISLSVINDMCRDQDPQVLKQSLNSLDRKQLTPLDEALQHPDGHLAAILIQRGADRCQDQIALKFYQRLAGTPAESQNPLVLQALQDLSTRHPAFNWQLSLHELLPTPTHGDAWQQGDLAIDSPTYGRKRLPADVKAQLMDPQGVWIPINQSGNHVVAYVGKAGLLGGHGLYFKVFPALPGIEEASSQLIRLFTPSGAPHSELMQLDDQLVLVSQAIPGPTLLDVLQNNPDQLQALDSDQVAQMILSAMLINPEDGKPDNYIVTPHPLNPQQYHLVSVDNDQGFVPAMVQERPDPGNLFRKPAPVVQVKTILYCLDHMTRPLPVAVRTQVINMVPDQMLHAWLDKLKRVEQRQSELVNSTNWERYFRQHNSFVGIPFQVGAIQHLYEKWMLLRDLVTQSPDITLIDLLAKLEPRLASRYRAALGQNISPLARFNQVDRPFYTLKASGSYTTQTQSHDILKSMDIPIQQSFAELVRTHKLRGPTQALAELAEIKQTLQTRTLQTLALRAGDQDLLKTLKLESSRAAFLKQLSQRAQLLSPQEQDTILNYLSTLSHLRNLTLANFTHLQDRMLEQRLNLDHLHSLDLRACTQITNKGLAVIAARALALEELNLSNSPQLTKIHAGDLFNSPLIFKMLTRLNLAHAINLTQINIQAPELTWLDVSHNSKLTDAGLDLLIQYSSHLRTLSLEQTFLISNADIRVISPFYSLQVISMEDKSIKKIMQNLLTMKASAYCIEDKMDIFSGQDWTLLTQLLSAKPGLTNLDLSYNCIGDAGTQALADNTILTDLNLCGNNIGVAGAQALAGNATLSSLTLYDNNIGDIGAQVLAGNTTLTSLDLQGNKIGNAGAQALAGNTTLSILYLSSNNIRNAGAQALAGNTTLTSLSLGNTNIGDAGRAALRQNTCLTKLEL